ncbi:Beta-fructosidases (levanase/invertase) [Streptococcus varani]|uniref:Sucrose-6-phosphate hydrolase n=1 Tax=Streptococcus varani TaxID=1608583 RepID=A0A0E3WF08_9STRE|nr:glycoside hydrolase family 32 protein [Streptococcus varani]CQR24654.1 Beta-fructosidases (levanase/invertase) [Streptococcus varani]
MRKKIEEVHQYIQENKAIVNQTFKPEKHFSAEIGWINDPNGCVFFRGEYHLFYQFYPYDSVWGPMHWGHAKTKDFVNWDHLPVALAPDMPYDKDGCFSGSAIVKDDTLWLMYTGNVVNEDGTVVQIQNMAYSKDGIHFEKIAENPVATGRILPKELVAADFRDPKLFEKNGRYYAVVAAKHQDEIGTVVLLGSDNLIDWNFESIFLKGEAHQGFMWECPDFFELDGQAFITVSPMRYQRTDEDFINLNSTVTIAGQVDWDKKVFVQTSVSELDHGHDFYAPQSLLDDKGQRITIAWMHNWGRTVVPHELKHGWACNMTLPRILHKSGEKLRQQVPDAVLASFPELHVGDELDAIGRLDLDIDQDIVLRLGDDSDYIEFGYQAGSVFIDRSHQKLEITGEEEWPINRRSVTVDAQHLQIFFDKNSVEIFVNHGQESLTSAIYLQGKKILQQV